MYFKKMYLLHTGNKTFYVHTAGGLIINFNKTNPWGIIYETSIFHLNQKFIKNAFLQP